MINRVTLAGNLTRSAEVLATTGKPMTKMRLATNHRWRDADGNRQEAAEFHSIVCFGRIAEICALYCGKGRKVYIEGRLRTREYTGLDGLRRLSTEIVAENVQLLDGPGVESAQAESGAYGEANRDGAEAATPDITSNGLHLEVAPPAG